MSESSVTTAHLQDFPLWDKMAARRMPLAFDLELTARCMNDCRHCYVNLPAGDPGARRKELTPEEIERDIMGFTAELLRRKMLVEVGSEVLGDVESELL